MRLPLELRREIYKLVLAEMFYPLHSGYKVIELEDLFVANICNRYRDLRQLLLNRQVGYEVLEIILARNTVLFYNYLTTTSDRKLRHPEYQPKLMPFYVIRELELDMYSDNLTRYRAPTLGFLELCTNLQYLSLRFGILSESALIIGANHRRKPSNLSREGGRVRDNRKHFSEVDVVLRSSVAYKGDCSSDLIYFARTRIYSWT